MTFIKCRANVVDSCLDGQPSRRQFGVNFMPGKVDPPLSEDGTFDGQTIVCDECYVEVTMSSPSGMGLTDEIEPTIARLRAAER